MVRVMVKVKFMCQRIIYSSLPAEDPLGSAAGCRQAIQDDFFHFLTC